MVGKRALNPFTDSVGKRFIHPSLFGRSLHAKALQGLKSGQLEMLPGKRQFFDSLAGQTLGMRRYYAL